MFNPNTGRKAAIIIAAMDACVTDRLGEIEDLVEVVDAYESNRKNNSN